jgi:hypothetical protein
MKVSLFVLLTTLTFSQIANAQSRKLRHQDNGPLQVSVREVTGEYQKQYGRESIYPTPTPNAGTKPAPGQNPYATPTPYVDQLPPFPGMDPTNPNNPNPSPYPYPNTYPTPNPNQVTLDHLITLGSKVWDFVINNKPTTTYQTLKASIVPSGITSWTQLRGWSRPVSKVYRVEFKNIYGKVAGSFDYRITFVYGGNFGGKGKYIGQISFVPANVKLHTDRSLDVKAELLEPLNFGTEDDPIAAAQLQITWSSPTTTRYQLNSVDLFLYATGEIQNLTDGN